MHVQTTARGPNVEELLISHYARTMPLGWKEKAAINHARLFKSCVRSPHLFERINHVYVSLL